MPISSPSNFFNYYKDCYKLDYKEFTVNNVLNAKYRYKWFVDGEEQLMNENSPIIYYDNKEVEALEKELLLYKLEKALYYGCFFIIGKRTPTGLSKDATICSPLVLFPSSIEDMQGDKFLRLNRNDFILNLSLINKIAKDDLSKEKLVHELTELFSTPLQDAFTLRNIISKYTVDVDAKELTLYPENWRVSQIRKYLKSKTIDDSLTLIPASGTIFIEKSLSSTKVINDLESIAKNNEFNKALTKLINQNVEAEEITPSLLESKLNQAQANALYNGQKYTNSVIIGPPGTGKSYSISAMAVDALLNHKSVLIVSKSKQAVNVIKNILENDYKLEGIILDTTGHRFMAKLRQEIKFRQMSSLSLDKKVDRSVFATYEKSKRLEENFQKLVKKELKLADLTFKDDLSIREYFDKFILTIIKNENLKFIETLEELESNNFFFFKELITYTNDLIKQHSKQKSELNRIVLSAYYEALNTSNFTKSQNIMKGLNFSKVVEVFPLWLSHLSEINTILPQQKDIFDLVIIDEATQCDIATALPAIYRAKHVVVCGDPNQLRHYSFISQTQQASLREKYDLSDEVLFDYRNKSILDVYLSKIPTQNQVSFLREHYRSTPSLIEFNNQEFYNNQLEIIKSTTEFTRKNQIELHYVKGERNPKGVNELEAKLVVDKLKEITNQYKSNNLKPSLGVITPFADQAKYINQLINEAFKFNIIKEFNISCGTPYQFQGSEREIILISFCVCNETHASAFRHLNQSEVLNVGTTRAKSFQYIYTSVDKNALNPTSLLFKYLDFIENYEYQKDPNHDNIDGFQKDVASYLSSLDIEDIHCGYPYAGTILDVFFTYKDQNFFIDLIGYPGAFYDSLSLERYKTFARVDIRTIPLHYRFWNENKEKAKETLKKIILK